MILLCDVDGVLHDFVGGVCTGLRARGFERTSDDIRHWDLKESFAPDELIAAIEIMAAPGFCAGLEWYDGARNFVEELKALGNLHIVTAPLLGAPTWVSERVAALSDHVAGDLVHFISGKYKHLVRGDVLIEDHPKNAVDWLEANPKGMAILIDRPWNSPSAREFWPHVRMFRVRSFDEALQAVRECA